MGKSNVRPLAGVSLTLAGGTIFDPSTGEFTAKDLFILDGQIATSADAPQSSNTIINVEGLLVTPGLVDLHTHLFQGQDAGIDADAVGARSGVTTMIDAGSAGGHLIGALRRTSIDNSATRVRAFLNIASIGISSFMLKGELHEPAYADPEVAYRAAVSHHDVVIGIKVRASGDVGGEQSPAALRRARNVADRLNLPLMVHLGPAPASIEQILDHLGSGDILTHCFTGFEGNSLLVDGVVRPAVLQARERGVLFDVGHGRTGFDSNVAASAIAQGFPPDTISSDLHHYSTDTVGCLPAVLSKLATLGMSWREILTCSTLAPARAAGLDALGIGTLMPGSPADVAVFRLEPEPIDLADHNGNAHVANTSLQTVMTIRAGRVAYDARDADSRDAPPTRIFEGGADNR